MRETKLFFAFLTIALISLALTPSAMAHEQRTIRVGTGYVQFEVGWIVEPPFVDQKNAVDFTATTSPFGAAVSGLDTSLRVEVSTGGKKAVLNLQPIVTEDGGFTGEYSASIIPTVPGTYTFRIFGAIKDTAVNETFTCGPKTFECVQPISDIQFPEKTPTGRELQIILNDIRSQLNQLNDLRSQLTQTRTDSQPSQPNDFARMRADVQNAYMLAVGGVMAGIIGILFGTIAIIRSRKMKK